jgi:cellulose biosynthesis protein BcsQ
MTSNYLKAAGHSILLMDGDYSNSATLYSLENRRRIGKKGFAEAIQKGGISDNAMPTRQENIDIVPSDKNIENVRLKSNDVLARMLEDESEALSVYDFIIIDTSQGYNSITANAIAASDLILTPIMMCQFDLMSCLALQIKIIEECAKYDSWHLFFNGVNQHILNPNSGSFQYMSLYKKTFKNCLDIHIPRTTAIVNAIDRDMRITRKGNEKLCKAIHSLACVMAGEALPEAEAF